MKRGNGLRSRGFGRGGAAARSREEAPAYPDAQRPKATRSSAEAERVLRGLPTLWTPEEWILLPQVRSGGEGLRVADLVAVERGRARRRILVEIKTSRGDWITELADPNKSIEIGQHCHGRVLAVPGQWDRIVADRSELPDGWGLVAVDGGQARLIVTPTEVDALEVPERLWISMLSSARNAGEREAGPDVGVPLREVIRPLMDHGVSGLSCGHVVPRPMSKGLRWPPVPCGSCAMGLPPDFEVLRAILAEATPDELTRYAAQIEALQARGIR